jgi:hypothetical protein
MTNEVPVKKIHSEKEKAKIGYNTVINLIELVSSEIYSRFNAMLTANSIMLGIIGLLIISNSKYALILIVIFSVAGIFFCYFWSQLIKHGVLWQMHFRDLAKELEKNYFRDVFKLMMAVDSEDTTKNIPKKYEGISSYYRYSSYIIDIFYILYFGIIILLVIQIVLSYLNL